MHLKTVIEIYYIKPTEWNEVFCVKVGARKRAEYVFFIFFKKIRRSKANFVPAREIRYRFVQSAIKEDKK